METGVLCNAVTRDRTSLPAKWHLASSNVFSTMHMRDRRTSRLTDHATVTSVAIDGIAHAFGRIDTNDKI